MVETILTAHLQQDCSLITQLSGRPASKPQNRIMTQQWLDNNVLLSDEQKTEFWQELRKNGSASILLPRNTSKFFVG